MSLLLAPYNNGMRLGQGFNSYTQQICIDDAVVIDPDRVDNPVSNDGFTMRDMRFAIGAREGTLDNDSYDDDYEVKPVTTTPSPGTIAPATGAPALALPAITQAPAPIDGVVAQVQQQAVTMKKLIDEIDALESTVEDAPKPDSDEIKAKAALLEKKKIRLAKLKTQENSRTVKTSSSRATANELANRGPSQIVTYTSRFVNKLSEVTDDMNISGSLSIKYGAIGGSGKGSFIDSDKFKESDLNFFISVKVINQSINIKDALVYQGLPSVDDTNFTEVFGDCFISGGEFNAVVSMKVLNSEKRTKIAAEAKIALAVGPGQIEAEAKVDVAKSDIKANTETTIQVGWSGGGHIKPMDQPWTIESLMETAARFPDLVANTPQRTYAILTKYESLRSFMALKPAKLNPIMYENAAIYTNALLDAYMDYKNIYRNLSTDIFDIQAGTKVFVPSMDAGVAANNETLSRTDDETKFAATYKGLDLARRACRFQMIKIVTEVDAVTKDPMLAVDMLRLEQYQSPIDFRDRLPKILLARAPPQVSLFGDEEKVYAPLLDTKTGDYVSQEETDKVKSLVADRKDISEHLRLCPAVGSDEGAMFCNIDFIKPEFALLQVAVEVADGVVCSLTTRYSNGLVASLGATGGTTREFLNIRPDQGERIIACSIETGRRAGEVNAKDRVTAIRMYTNRGPDLVGNAGDWKAAVDGKGIRGGIAFEGLTLKHFDPLLANGHLKGFWGRSVNTAVRSKRTGIYRLGPVWGDTEDASVLVAGSALVADEENRIEAEGGFVIGLDNGWKTDNNFSLIKDVLFSGAKPSIPTVLYGLRKVDIVPPHGPRVSVDVPNVTKEGFKLAMKGWDSVVFNLEANWMVLPENNIQFQHGVVSTEEVTRTPQQNASFRIYFARPYRTEPKVTCWFTEVDQPKGWRSLRCHVSNVSASACTINIETWAGREFAKAKVMWLAWDAERDGKNIRSRTEYFGPGQGPTDTPWYLSPYARDCAFSDQGKPEAGGRYMGGHKHVPVRVNLDCRGAMRKFK